jgi:voltage-gated sodium channel
VSLPSGLGIGVNARRSEVESDDENDLVGMGRHSSRAYASTGYTRLSAIETDGEPSFQSAFPQCEFVTRTWFQKIIGCVILFNVTVLWGETDLPHQPIWVICDNGLLTIFLFELVCRILYWGWSFLTGKDKWWHLLDGSVVVLGVWDTWLIKLLSMEDGGNSPLHHMRILRTFRLLRLLRLIRIIKIFNKVMLVVEGLGEVFHKFLWIFLALFFFIFCSSIILVKTLGEGIGIMSEQEGMEEEAEFLRAKFRNVPASVFTLFQVATLDEWDVIAGPVIQVNPVWRLFFYCLHSCFVDPYFYLNCSCL